MRISDWSSDVCSSDLGVSFSLVTSKPVIKDGQIQKDENGYTETYDEFHTVKAFNGLGKSVANHKKKGDKLMVVGEIRYSRNERDGRTYYKTDIVAEENELDRKSVVEGKSGSVRVEPGGGRNI